MPTPLKAKRLDARAYNALEDALALICWYKKNLERHLRSALRDVPEILASLDFTVTKRETASLLVDLLMADEERYQDIAVALMLNVAAMESFPDLARHEERDERIAAATAAVAELRMWTQRHQEILDARAEYAQNTAAALATAAKNRAFSEDLDKLKVRFLSLSDMTDPHGRGYALECFLNDLFGLFDFEPRAAYSLKHEQIDGAFSFDTDDYILESKWWKKAMGRDSLDVFAAKINRRGKNALGLYVSVSGFSPDGRAVYQYSTPFITMEGADLLAVLEERVRLDDLLRRKKRHMNETGSCYFPAGQMD
jgi:hypothetical protein